jgi:hypothetical protein
VRPASTPGGIVKRIRGIRFSPLAGAKPNAVRASRRRFFHAASARPSRAAMERHPEGDVMPLLADSATLNVQPRQRRTVYERLATVPAGCSVRELLEDLEMPESELRETLRKLDQAGLARRGKGVWQAIPIEQPERDSTTDVVA